MYVDLIGLLLIGRDASNPFNVWPPSHRSYEECSNLRRLVRQIRFYQDEYNLTGKEADMSLVFFPDAVRHLLRIGRILRQPRGNAILIGLAGETTCRTSCLGHGLPNKCVRDSQYDTPREASNRLPFERQTSNFTRIHGGIALSKIAGHLFVPISLATECASCTTFMFSPHLSCSDVM